MKIGALETSLVGPARSICTIPDAGQKTVRPRPDDNRKGIAAPGGKPRRGAVPAQYASRASPSRIRPRRGQAPDRQPIEPGDSESRMFGARKDGKAAASGQRARIEERIRGHGA
jgi:hypothetical protein